MHVFGTSSKPTKTADPQALQVVKLNMCPLGDGDISLADDVENLSRVEWQFWGGHDVYLMHRCHRLTVNLGVYPNP